MEVTPTFAFTSTQEITVPVSESVLPCYIPCVWLLFIYIFIIIQVHHVTCTLGQLSHVGPCIKTEDGLK